MHTYDPDKSSERAHSAFARLFGAALHLPHRDAEILSAGLQVAKEVVSALTEININLNRIANASEAQRDLMAVDVADEVRQALEQALPAAVNDAVRESTKRDYIGKKPA